MTAELIALRDEYRSVGNLRFFEQMKKMLMDEPDQPSQAQVASELGMGQRTRSNKPLSISSALPKIISTGDCPHSRSAQRIEDELRDLLLQSGRNLC